MPEPEAKKRILITGATGFVGSHVVQELLRRGHDVFAIIRPNRAVDSVSEAGRTLPAEVQSILLDLSDREALQAAFREVRPELAIHLAWYTAPGKYGAAPENLDWVAATLDLARALAAAGCSRFVGAGSCAEYDWDPGFLSETHTPLKPQTLYGSCKDATRRILQAYCHQAAMEFVWARLFFIYGPGEHRERLVPSVIRSLLRGERAKCSAGGLARDFLYVGDAASAIASVALGPGTGAINIASGRPIQIRAMVEAIARIMRQEDRIDFGAVRANPAEPSWLCGDIQRLTSISSWLPATSLEDGLEQTVAWWTANSTHMSVGTYEALPV